MVKGDESQPERLMNMANRFGPESIDAPAASISADQMALVAM